MAAKMVNGEPPKEMNDQIEQELEEIDRKSHEEQKEFMDRLKEGEKPEERLH